MKIKNYQQVIHYFAQQYVTNNSIIIDATCGNGNDTLYLAQHFNNPIIACDIQPQAINNTKKRCYNYHHITYVCDNHANLASYYNCNISFAIFNLGYLPYSNSPIITQASFTIKAIINILKHLIPGGGICIMIYTNHDHSKEAQEIDTFLQTLDKNHYLVLKYQFMNLDNPPYLIIIEKKHIK